MSNVESNANQGIPNPERKGAQIFNVTLLKDLGSAPIDINEFVQEAPCCGSLLSQTVGPVGFTLGSFHELRVVCPRCACLVCSCGNTNYPSNKSDDYVIQAGREIRDFVNGDTPDDWLYQHIGMADVGRVKEFKRLVEDRIRERDSKRKDS